MGIFFTRLNTLSSLNLRAKMRFIAVSVTILLVLSVLMPTLAQESLGLEKSIIGNPTTVNTGDVIEYRLVYSCNSLTSDCGTLTVVDVLPTGVTWLETQVASGFSAGHNNGTVTITSDGIFADGSQSEAIIRARVDFDVPGGTVLENSASGDRSNSPANPDVITPTVSVTVNEPTFQWEVNKTQISPAINPTLDNDVSYRLSICSQSAIGNVTLDNVTLVDDLPPDVVIIDAGGGTVSGTNPQSISWTLGELDIATIGDGCVSRTITIQYPSSTYAIDDIPDNVATATGNWDVEGDVPDCETTLCTIGTQTYPTEIDPAINEPQGSKSNSGTIIGVGGVGRYFIDFNTNNANTAVTNLVVEDDFPIELQITQINAVNWPAPATLEYSTNDGAIYTSYGTFGAGDSLGVPADVPDGITNLRWTFAGTVDFGESWRAEIVFTPRDEGGANDAVSGNTYTNCLDVTADAPATPDLDNCSSVTIDDDSVVIAPAKDTVGASTLRPLDVVTFNLRLRIDERSAAALLQPVIIEALPNNLEYITDTGDPDYTDPVVTFTNVQVGEQIAPNLTVNTTPTNIEGVGYDTLLEWRWPAGYELSAPVSGISDINIQFTARVRAGTVPDNYANVAYFLSDSPDLVCTGSQLDTEDADGDSDSAEDRCRVSTDYEVEETVVLSSQKWISNQSYQNDGTFTGFLNTEISTEPEPDLTCPSSIFNGEEYTRFPCITQGFPDNTNFAPPDPDTFDDFNYWLIVSNEGNVPGIDYILYDILPYVGDTGSGGPLSTSARLSEFQPYITGPVVVESAPGGINPATDLIIEYSNSTNPCRTEVFGDTGGNEPAGCVNDWTTVPPSLPTPNAVRAFRIRFANSTIQFPVNSAFEFSVPMRIPEDAQSGQIAWNTFAQRISNPSTGRIPTSESRKVGIIVPERMSVGNYVWYDYNNDGTPLDDAGNPEDPVGGVTVSLYRDANNDGQPDGPAIATDVTDANGYYLFSDISFNSLDPTQNRYVIGIESNQFDDPTDALYEHLSSSDPDSIAPTDDQTDLNDNGIDDLDPATNGIFSPSFVLSLDDEPENETQLSGDDPASFPTGNYPDGPFSRGVRAEADNNSDLTIDFGFYVPMSIGNRVWLDLNVNNNGIEDQPTETANGVAGVTLTLYRDNGDGIFDNTDIPYIYPLTNTPATTTTDADGYYLFDNLPPGDYFVAVDQANFNAGGALQGYEDSDNAPTEDVDRENKGDNNVFLGSSGVVSILTTLEPFNEPIAGVEVDQTIPAGFVDGFGNFGELDENSNLTVDFGFWQPGMALGNYVWLDVNNNSAVDAGETGIAGVTVNLYQDADENGVPDTAVPLFSTTTNVNGWYLFDGLAPGSYVLEIPASDFNGAGPLVGLISSHRNDTIDTYLTGETPPYDDQQDDGLNQASATDYRANGVFTETVTLIPVSEPFELPLDTSAEDPGDLGFGAGGKDENSDLTVDFGFFEPLSIGNRVWLDDYSSGDGVTVKGDGVFDPINETPLDNVILTLYVLNDGGDPANLADYSIVQFDGVDQVDTTDDDGYYLFDGLGEGTYRVLVDASNFNAGGAFDSLPGNPEDYRSSVGVDGADNTDSGIDDDAPASNGIFSEPIVLTLGNEPTGETDANDSGQAVNRDDGPDGFGVYEEQDDNSDLTVDFGFFIPPMSLGNRVWYDTNNNGLIDSADDNPATPGNPGIGSVQVNLYDAGDTTTPVATTITDADGYYRFDDLLPGDYVVGIPITNFSAGNALVNLTSSTGNGGDTGDDSDVDENGIDDLTVPLPNEIFSETITLSLGDEPLAEGDLGVGDPGLNGETDDNSDLTIDFGFYEPMSIGNVVWLDNGDDGAGGFTIAEFNNAVQDADEDGIPGVAVHLYLDNGDGTFDSVIDTLIDDAEVTDANGYYLFDGLTEGNYFVYIPPINFTAGQPLFGLLSSFSNTADKTTDLNDNGLDVPVPASTGVVSNLIALELRNEITGESDLSNNAANDGADFRGRFGETDNNSNLTIDFGFNEAPMSLGNRVWFDGNNNGLIDAGETGVPGAVVSLYLGSDTTTPIATTTTDADGYYLFDNLTSGDYVVGVSASNFGATAVLENYASSTVNTPNGDANVGDSDDNGVDDPAPATNGIFSDVITLAQTTEPTANADPTLGEDDQTIPAVFTGTFGDNGETDDNSNLTVDFGFFIPMSLGNRVWLDNGAGSLNNAGYNNGIQDGTEAGIADVTVNLLQDNGTGTFVQIATTITDADGYYLFDGLTEGSYIVEIPAGEFNGGDLTGLTSSFPLTVNGDANTGDEDDNGMDDPDPVNNGIQSAPITLTNFTMPTTSADPAFGESDQTIPTGFLGAFGDNGETDNNSNLTIDFGFNEAPMSLGNRVWLDDNNTGTIDAGDGVNPGIAGVALSLYLASDTTTSIATTTTDANGYYLFDNLTAGDYVVGVDASNFGAAAILENYASSTVNTPNGDANVGDSDDNGVDDPAPATNGILSDVITLAQTTEPTTNADPTLGEDDQTIPAGFTGAFGDNGETDDNSNLTLDFGFFRSMSIGNVVWADNSGPLNDGIASNGIQDGSEVGLPNIVLRLYLDNGNNTFDLASDSEIATTTTDANGFYLFDGLIPGTYFVWVDSVNFAPGNPLADFDSSPGNGGDDGTDLDDNGVDENFPATNGVVSLPIVLARDTEPTGEVVSNNPFDGPNFRGNNNETDNNSDLTIDFGFNTEPFSLGNRVWYDPNNNGVLDIGEQGLAGVTVNLYRDNNDNGAIDAGELVTSTITDANGYYLFDGLTQGFYFVELSEFNFRLGGPLVDMYSSTGNGGDTGADSDVDENGVDNLNPEVNGIVSERIELSKNNEPINEADLSNNPADGPDFRGNNGELDSNSDLTVDFSLYKPISLGNRVWFDIDDNGLIDPLEAGIAGVVVNLYQDDGTGNFIQIATDTTDANGYYLFENLIPGDYYVEVDPSNFGAGQPLESLNSSTGATTTPTDSNDNGVDDPDPVTNGIRSNTVMLDRDSQPTGETDTSGNPADGPNFIGNNGETDNNSDLTVDFGFTGAQLSLGNRVWLDPNNNGVLDAGEQGIANVTINLYRDTDANGLPNGAVIATTTTDANGYYIFDGLTPGDYVVAIPNANFNTGNPLVSLLSSTGNGGDTGDDSDVDENGIDGRNPTYGILSVTINLAINSEPTTETDLGPDGDGTNGETPENSDLTVDFAFYRPMSLGNRVWFDTDADGIRDNTEPGIANVIVNLYQDDGTGTFVVVATTTTNTNGYYRFDGLGEGDYYVEIENTNFQAGGALESLNSTSPDTTNNADNNDNGIDDADPATNGIRSNTTTLTLGTEATNENDIGPGDPGANGEINNNSDLTIDFGFTGGTLALGNRVWFDDNRDGIRDDGVESPVPDVAISLYRDANADGVPDGASIATTTTDANGYYLFDGLAPGNYIVGLNASNFATAGDLSGYTSTTTGTPDTDDNDNGVDNNNPALNGILSATIALQPTTEPTGEPDLGPGGNGTNGETDDNSNLTVDFGLYKPLSLGNRVWFDADNNGVIDAGEVGIGGVTVNLYDASDLLTPLLTDVTDGEGYYLFDDLEPGDYVVEVEPSNFQTGGNLIGFISSTGATTNNTDSNDNGADDPTPEINGILSNIVTLTADNTPTGETDLSGNVQDGPNFRGTNGESDNNSDLTVDFGFFANAMSLGNRVWLDDGGTTGIINNGLQDGDEAGIADVVVNLYADVNADGVPDGAILATDTTDADGYYLFDGLPPGNYLVRIAPANFATGNPLFGLFSSTGSDNTPTDSNDNGIDDANASTNGIFSDTITLVPDNSPTGETDLGPEGNGSNGENDENADLTIDFGFSVAYDLGDAPDSYGTTTASNGAQHVIVSSLRLGRVIDDEADGQPSVDADGDDTSASDDEDSITFPILIAGTTVVLDVTAFNNSGNPTNLVLWIDFDDSGTFDAGEGFTAIVPSDPAEQVIPVTVIVPIDADTLTDDDGDNIGETYARVRLTTDAIGTGDPTGLASDGEVEDYQVFINPPGISITKSDGQNSIVLGQSTTYTVRISNSGPNVVNRRFIDAIPIADPDGFDPVTVTWTCSATAGASCISGEPAGTGDTGTGQIDTFIDIPRDGGLVFELTGTLRVDYSQPTVTNVAELESGERAEDINGVIFDPPQGIKIGRVIGANRIRWTMVWLNTGGPQAATITDVINAPQRFDGNLDCVVFGTSTQNSCQYNGATNTVTWQGIIGTGNPNRVEISFDVLVPGDGNYTNITTIDIGNETASASDSVQIGDPDSDSDSDASPAPVIEDPIIVKLVDPQFIQPGEEALWTITVTNPNNVPLNDIQVSDVIPDVLSILDATTSNGTVLIEGRVIRVQISTLAPSEVVTIAIRTRLNPNIDQSIVSNTAFLDAPYIGDATGELFVVSALPDTGETPFWWVFLPFLAVSGLGILIGLRRRLRR
ncbi:MAG: SdrD B-like domain-containing protein [Anaerolineae bacterium]